MAKSEVYNTDCIEYMRTLPDDHFDLAVCDPPYGHGNDESLLGGGGQRFGQRFQRYFNQQIPSGGGIREVPQTASEDGSTATSSQWNRLKGGRRERYYSIESGGGKLQAPQWDVAPPQEFFDELFRVSKNQIIWGGNYFSLPPTRCFLVWRKKNIAQDFSMAMCEYAWTSFTGNAKVFEHTSLRNDHSGKFHPTEKPQELYGWIYRNFLEDGQTVFDPMMGSQASRISAYKMGIDYVGCEIDKYYYDKGCEWFERECHGITKTASGKTIIEQTLFEL